MPKRRTPIKEEDRDPSTYRFDAKTDTIQTLLDRNAEWATRFSGLRPLLFDTEAINQYPKILWIGCSDSRVPETTILDLYPGEVFVHRNIANCLPPTDLSSLSAIQYAVEYIGVKHVIVCGHTNCGGCAAALKNDKLGLIDVWLKTIREVREAHQEELDKITDPFDKTDRLVELNVLAQIKNLKQNHNIVDGLKKQTLQVHGLIYDTETGKLRLVEEVDQKVNEAVYHLPNHPGGH